MGSVRADHLATAWPVPMSFAATAGVKALIVSLNPVEGPQIEVCATRHAATIKRELERGH